MIDTVSMNQAIPYLRDLARQYSAPIEVLGLATGTGDDCLNRFSIPKVLGLSTEERDLLDNLAGRGRSTKAVLAVDLSSAKNGLGVKISCRLIPGRNQETSEFFGADVLITPHDGGLASYLPAEVLESAFPCVDVRDITNAMLEKYVRHAGIMTTINDAPYLYVPIPLTAGAYGTKNSYYNTDVAVSRIVDMNRCDAGDAVGDIHVHYAESRESARPDQLALMKEIGDDYFRYPSSFDFISFANSRTDFEVVLNHWDFGRRQKNSKAPNGAAREIRTAQLVMRAVVALTPPEHSSACDVVGMSVLDIRTFTADPAAEDVTMAAAKKANSPDATVGDKVRYFSIIKDLVKDTMPDFVDMSC